jgi:hypothetical protein
MDLDTLPDMLRVEEAAAVLRISRSRAYDEVATFQRTRGAEGLPSIRGSTGSWATSMPPDDRWLLIDVVAAEDVRVRVGPIGWVVLEAMVSLAPPGPVPVEVEYSARSLAGLVGVSKDKVARSLASIIVLGIVERVDHRHELSGRFLSTTYRVDLSTVGITVVGLHMPALVQSTSAPSRASVRTSASQLSLLS